MQWVGWGRVEKNAQERGMSEDCFMLMSCLVGVFDLSGSLNLSLDLLQSNLGFYIKVKSLSCCLIKSCIFNLPCNCQFFRIDLSFQ